MTRTMRILRRSTVYLRALGSAIFIYDRSATDAVTLKWRSGCTLAWLLVVSVALFCVQPDAVARPAPDSTAELRETLAGLMAHPALHGARVGAAVVSIPSADTVYSLYPKELFVPASTIKLVVTASALRLLGPQFVYHTSVLSGVPPTQQGVIPDDLIIRGTGDPTLDSGQYRRIACQLKAQGISAVQGNIVGEGPVTAADRAGGSGAARALRLALVGQGIRVVGSPTAGTAPPSVYLLYRKVSTSLREYIQPINLASDNQRGERLVRSLRAIFGAGDTPYGFISELWLHAGVDVSSLQLIDGSGMSHRNRASPALLTSVLVKMVEDSSQFTALADSLPVAGVSGTLSSRMKDTVAEGRVYAKTGTLNRVSSLAGYIIVDGTPRLAFALMMSGYSCPASKVRKIQAQAAIHITRYALANSERLTPPRPFPPSLRPAPLHQ